MNNTTLLLILAGGGIAVWAIMRQKPAQQIPDINIEAPDIPEQNLGGKIYGVVSDVWNGKF